MDADKLQKAAVLICLISCKVVYGGHVTSSVGGVGNPAGVAGVDYGGGILTDRGYSDSHGAGSGGNLGVQSSDGGYGLRRSGRYGVDENNQDTPYHFGYSVVNLDGSGQKRLEASDGKGRVTGEYKTTLADGRTQTVRYNADHSGYHADVSYDGVAAYPRSSGSGGYPGNTGGLNVPGGSSGELGRIGAQVYSNIAGGLNVAGGYEDSPGELTISGGAGEFGRSIQVYSNVGGGYGIGAGGLQVPGGYQSDNGKFEKSAGSLKPVGAYTGDTGEHGVSSAQVYSNFAGVRNGGLGGGIESGSGERIIGSAGGYGNSPGRSVVGSSFGGNGGNTVTSARGYTGNIGVYRSGVGVLKVAGEYGKAVGKLTVAGVNGGSASQIYSNVGGGYEIGSGGFENDAGGFEVPSNIDTGEHLGAGRFRNGVGVPAGNSGGFNIDVGGYNDGTGGYEVGEPGNGVFSPGYSTRITKGDGRLQIGARPGVMVDRTFDGYGGRRVNTDRAKTQLSQEPILLVNTGGLGNPGVYGTPVDNGGLGDKAKPRGFTNLAGVNSYLPYKVK